MAVRDCANNSSSGLLGLSYIIIVPIPKKSQYSMIVFTTVRCEVSWGSSLAASPTARDRIHSTVAPFLFGRQLAGPLFRPKLRTARKRCWLLWAPTVVPQTQEAHYCNSESQTRVWM